MHFSKRYSPFRHLSTASKACFGSISEEASDSHVYCQYRRFRLWDLDACSQNRAVSAHGYYEVGFHSLKWNKLCFCLHFLAKRVFDVDFHIMASQIFCEAFSKLHSLLFVIPSD